MKKQFNALIVDDERLARKELISMLTEFANINIAGEAGDVPAAIKSIEELKPDVVFLDIQMPGTSGFDLLEKIDAQIKIIFVTAFDEYAIRAFEVNALDYLLKPINPERLSQAIEKLEIDHLAESVQTRQLNYDDRLFISFENRMRFIKVSSIACIHSAGDYSEITTSDKQKGLTLKSMKEWEHRLPENYFIRIHRSSIINLEVVDRLEEWFNYSYKVYLKGIEEPLVMSRRYVAKLKEKMG